MCIFGNNGAAKQQAALAQKQADDARADTERKAGLLRTGKENIDNAFGGFDDNYFSNLAKNYTNYATPQLEDQYNEQKKNIVFSLARKNNLNSTVFGDEQALLDKQNAQGLATIAGTGRDYAAKARQDVQTNKDTVMDQLNATYDVGQATSDALQRSRTLSNPISFSPLQSLFTNVSALAAQNRLASDSGAGGGSSSAGARLFNSRNGSSSLVGA